MATIPLEAAAAAMREAMRDTVKRYSLWYLLQGILMVVAGILALVYPLIAIKGEDVKPETTFEFRRIGA